MKLNIWRNFVLVIASLQPVVATIQLWVPNCYWTKTSALWFVFQTNRHLGFVSFFISSLFSFSLLYCCSVEWHTYLYASIYQAWDDVTENVGMSICLEGVSFSHHIDLFLLRCTCYQSFHCNPHLQESVICCNKNFRSEISLLLWEPSIEQLYI